jgi:FAD/FMN-containing dehydrogenase
MQSENWEDDGEKTCSVNAPASAPCYQGQVSVQGVQVEEISDVQKTIQFGSRHNLRVVVKTSGHDFLGRSTAAGSFLIWMHKLKNLTIHDSFVRCGRPATPAVTVVGGIPWGEVYDALNATGYIVVGAMSLTVGAAGGYVQGGGHGALRLSFGLAVDSVLEIEVVTADGKLRIANACQEPDLFFSLRGGGGGTFGVVISVPYKLHRTPTSLAGIFIALQAPNGTLWPPTTQEQILTEWSHASITLESAQWGGIRRGAALRSIPRPLHRRDRRRNPDANPPNPNPNQKPHILRHHLPRLHIPAVA